MHPCALLASYRDGRIASGHMLVHDSHRGPLLSQAPCSPAVLGSGENVAEVLLLASHMPQELSLLLY